MPPRAKLKMTGRMYNERLGKLHFWWMFIGFNVTFFTMHFPGIEGMNRRIADYPAAYESVNLFISLTSFALGASFFVFIFNMVYSWVRGTAAESSPWRARTLEWQTTSPPPLENFPRIPVIVGHPYDYGVSGSVHATFAPATVPVSGGGGGAS